MSYEFHIDFSELTDFQIRMMNLATEYKNGKHAKEFLRRTGNRAKTQVRKVARESVKKQYTGNLLAGIKRGKAYFYAPTNSFSVRVYGGSPAYHTNLVNYGHHIILPSGAYWGYFEGYNYFERGLKNYESIFYEDVENFVEKLIHDYLL